MAGRSHSGSSPRVRGTASRRRRHCATGRFIPACAGNRRGPGPRRRRRSVHPRVCGEQAVSAGGVQDLGGSSPRVRGTEPVLFTHARVGRFIPACAGNSPSISAPTKTRTVHPRVCGEQVPDTRLIWQDGGSSPRVRGTGDRRHREDRRHRFIPACAGNSECRTARMPSPAVHPRVCGEQALIAYVLHRAFGSSPRVRGTGAPIPPPQALARFIPACAGNRTI